MNICWDCIKHRHRLCTGRDVDGPCECKHVCQVEDDENDRWERGEDFSEARVICGASMRWKVGNANG